MTGPTSEPHQLESYVCNQWVRGSGPGKVLNDASTGEPVALIDSTGIDFAEVLEHGRTVGNPALRKLTFHQRAAMLKEMGKYLAERKEEFYALSTATGATRTDSWIDIEGGFGTLFAYSSMGRSRLPDATLLVDGDLEPLSRDGTFVGQHILVPLEGVAIHINAFNFPVWGMLEKLAPTFLAGMPTIVKPAAQTAYLTELVVRRMIESKILPEGSLQLISGSPRDMLDNVTCQDVVTVTGSAKTGRMLKSHPNVVEHSVRFTMEADSLNCSILGSDAEPGTEEFDLFVKEVASEITIKAGQRCTAIRRTLVPRVHTNAFIEAVSARLSKTTVGHPGEEGVRMGPLASLAQREEVRGRIEELKSAAEVVFGDPDEVDVVSGDPEAGAFLNPVVLYCDDPTSGTVVHDVEAFGPVTTVLPYDDLDDAAALARRGLGSLVASVFTNDGSFARDAVAALAPWHGRILINNRDSAKASTGHGSPLPALIHGGPGRAGGGEEMGGIRGVKHFMQRSALQGSPDIITSATEG
jgi:oxepin-CoA hydrolase / 3-oxo-5,6-dehydrosuberyl-CoA semialdehyde dehydrogenase